NPVGRSAKCKLPRQGRRRKDLKAPEQPEKRREKTATKKNVNFADGTRSKDGRSTMDARHRTLEGAPSHQWGQGKFRSPVFACAEAVALVAFPTLATFMGGFELGLGA